MRVGENKSEMDIEKDAAVVGIVCNRALPSKLWKKEFLKEVEKVDQLRHRLQLVQALDEGDTQEELVEFLEKCLKVQTSVRDLNKRIKSLEAKKDISNILQAQANGASLEEIQTMVEEVERKDALCVLFSLTFWSIGLLSLFFIS
jgi:predicted transcriptional regulator